MQQFFSLLSWHLFTLNIFRASSRPSSGAQCLQWQPLVLPSYRGDSHAVFVVGPAGRPWPRTPLLSQRYEGKTRGCYCSCWAPDDGWENSPKTCWAVNKRQDNKLENCWIWLEVYLNTWWIRIKFGIYVTPWEGTSDSHLVGDLFELYCDDARTYKP